MKKIKLTVLAVLATAFLFVSCGTTGMSGGSTSSSTSSSGSIGSSISDVLGAVLGYNASLTKADLQGTWNYIGTDCKFKSDDLLKKAGGELVAGQIETKMDETFSKIGIKRGACTFIFNTDNSFSATLGTKKISGTYVFDETNKKVTLTYLMGLATMDANVSKSGSAISLLFDADKILSLLSVLASVSNNTSIKAIGELAGQYDGLLVGFQLQK